MKSIKEFRQRLESFRKPDSDDPYEDRITHCYLEYIHKGKPHQFEVRGWSRIKENYLTVYAVCWTLTAGPCSIEINESNVGDYRIYDK